MAHEDLKREYAPTASSDRAFGLVFAAVLAAISAWPLAYGAAPRWWAAALAAAFGLAALLRPGALAQPNRLWTRLGLALGRVFSPLALAVLYYGVMTPIGYAARLAGKDPLRLKRERASASYWLPRDPPGPKPGSMTDQF